ncbi:MAG: CDP-alcohol phosphatidyltransferase family protein [Crocinitomicaceae bacterium]|nr:CDP-alcohol phosphatidyltransferase family protein [Crocinitomicaceae bacterium]
MFSIFNIPNLLTSMNMMCGIAAILLSIYGRIDLAPFAIFAGAILDFFDGFVARLLKQQGELGKQLDSLADTITFGLAPGIMILVLLTYAIDIPSTHVTDFGSTMKMSYNTWFESVLNGSPTSYLPFFALLIPFMSMFRLAKFNIDLRQGDSFIGLNTPANTIFFTSFPLILASQFSAVPDFSSVIYSVISPWFMISMVIFMSFMLISEIPFFSFKFKHYKWSGNQLRFGFILTCLILIPTLLAWSIPIVVFLYIILSIIENLFLKNKQHEIQS